MVCIRADVSARVSDALERVRPYLGSHGGDVELVSVDETSGVVKLRLGGSCDGCPSSMVTVKLAVEGAIEELAPEITRVEVEGMADDNDRSKPIDSLLAKVHPNENSATSNPPTWKPFDSLAPQNSGELLMAEVAGEPIMLCRVGKMLYAYRGKCPSCGSTIESGVLTWRAADLRLLRNQLQRSLWPAAHSAAADSISSRYHCWRMKTA